MPFIIFASKEDHAVLEILVLHNLSLPMEERVNEPISCLESEEEESYRGVYVLPPRFVHWLDKKSVQYKQVEPKEITKYLSGDGVEQLKHLCRHRPQHVYW